MVQLMPLHHQTPLSLASFKSGLVLPFWYWLTQVVLETVNVVVNIVLVVIVICKLLIFVYCLPSVL